MGFLDIFKKLNKAQTTKWNELGSYTSTFSQFGNDAYASATARSCIRALSEYTGKSTAKCADEKLERLLNNRPNMYMNGYDFLTKVRTRLELYNTAFIYIQRDDRGKVAGLYPVPCSYFEAVQYAGGLYIKFHFSSEAISTMTIAWEDLAVLRKDYNTSDIAGDANTPVTDILQMMQTTNEGLLNSIKATSNLRGILKSTKAMLAPEMVKEQRDQFVKDYMTLENAGGIASLDSTQDFIKIDMKPETATFEQMAEIRTNVYRYYGVNDDIIMGSASSEQLANFYELRIRPFLVALSQELTSKIYTGKAAAFPQNKIVYIAENGQFMTMAQKIDLFQKVVEYGGMLINEWRDLLGLGPIEGGDRPLTRLDAARMGDDEQSGTDITQMLDDSAEAEGLGDDESEEVMDEELEDIEDEEVDESEDLTDETAEDETEEAIEEEETDSEEPEDDDADPEELEDLTDLLNEKLGELFDSMDEILDRAEAGEFDDEEDETDDNAE